MSVQKVALKTIAAINPPTPSQILPCESEVAFVPMAAVSEDGTMRVSEHKIASEISNGFTYFRSNDILVAKITPCFENNKIAEALIDRAHGFGSTEFHVIRPDTSRLNGRYLLHFLRQDRVRGEGVRKMTGSAGQRRVPRYFLEDLKVPLPPLSEQTRIAENLDRVAILRRQRQIALFQSNEFSISLFISMFGDPVHNNLNWKSGTYLGDVADIASGITKGRKINGHAVRTVPYLAVANVQDRALNLSNVKTIEATEDEINRYRLLANDLLLTEGGDPDKLGRGTLWQEELPECIHQNHIFRVRVTSKEIHPLFLNWLVGSQRGKQYFLRSAKQTTGIASINMTQLRNFPLLLPPRSLQDQFAARVAEIDKLKALHRAHLAKLDELFASLQYRAFRGEL